MEFLYLSIPILSGLFCLIFSLSYFFYSQTKLLSGHNPDGKEPVLPPGRTGWPFIGETFEYATALRSGNHETFFQTRFQKYSAKVFRTSLFGEPFAVLYGAAGNKFLFSNENKAVQSWYPKSVEMVITSVTGTSKSIDETLRKERKLILTSLNAEALQRFAGVIDSEAKKHFETYWDNKETVPVVSLTRDYVFTVAYRLFLNVGDNLSLRNEISKLINDASLALFSLPIYIPGGKLSRGVKAARVLKEKLTAIIEQRKTDLLENKALATQDILSGMLLSSDENNEGVDARDIASEIFGLFLGAGESTTSSISLVMMCLAENPHIYNKVWEEQMEIAKAKAPGELLNWKDVSKMKYLWNVTCETLRLKSPAMGGFRTATSSFNYEGFTIPKGWRIQWSGNHTHMNPDYFPDPEKFDPSRFEGNGPAPYTYVPFGGGPRMCPGKEFARLVMLIFLHNAVVKYKWEKIIPDEKSVTLGVPLPGKGLPVRLQHSKSFVVS